jgi:autotransporter-associated beta strand protein
MPARWDRPACRGANATLDSSVALNLGNAIDLDAGAQLSLISNQNVPGRTDHGTGGLIKTAPAFSLNNSNFQRWPDAECGRLSVGNAALGTGCTEHRRQRFAGCRRRGFAGQCSEPGRQHADPAGQQQPDSDRCGGRAGGLIKNGASTLTLSGANTFLGGATVNAGTLARRRWQPRASVRWTSPVPARRWTSPRPATQTIGALNGRQPCGAGRRPAFGGASNGSFAGVIDGSGGLVKAGTGVQTLSGANTFSGGVALNAGGLILGNGGAGNGALGIGGNVSWTSRWR